MSSAVVMRADASPAGGPAPGGRFRRRLILNSLVTTSGNLWAIVISAVSLPLTLHGLGAEAFGIWALVQAFSAFTGWFALADIGVGVAATRAIAGHTSLGSSREAARVEATALAWFAAAGMVAASVFLLFGLLGMQLLFDVPGSLRPDLRFAVIVFAVQLAADFVGRGMQFCLEGYNRVDFARATDAARRTVSVGGAAVAASLGGGLRGVALASFAGSLILVVGCPVLLRRCNVERSRPELATLKELLVYGRQIAVLRPIGVLHRTMDRVIVGIALGPSAVAVVEVASQLATSADAVVSAASYSVTPSAAWLDARDDRARMGDLLGQGTKACTLLAMPFVLIPAVLSAPLLRVWVDVDSTTVVALVVLAFSYVAVTAPLQVGSNLLVGVGDAHSVLRPALHAVVVNVVLSVVLVRWVGVIGPSIATLVSAPVLVIPLWRSAALRVGESAMDVFTKNVAPILLPAGLLAATAAGALLLPASDLVRLCAASGLGLVIYFGTAYVFVMTRAEQQVLRSLGRKVLGR